MTEQNFSLMEEVERLNDSIRKLHAEQFLLMSTAGMNEAQLLSRIEQLRNALKFYAAENNQLDVMKDKGRRAREVLASTTIFE